MLGLITGYAVGKARANSRQARAARPTDPAYDLYEFGVVVGIAFLLFAWPIAMGYWMYRTSHNWWWSILVPLAVGSVCLALIPLWVIASFIAIGYWMSRLQAADTARVRAARVTEALEFERALEQRRRQIEGN